MNDVRFERQMERNRPSLSAYLDEALLKPYLHVLRLALFTVWATAANMVSVCSNIQYWPGPNLTSSRFILLKILY